MNSHDLIQAEAVAKLSKLRAGALFMKMGTGKTKVALELIISRQHDFDSVLWLAPASLIREESYHREISKWSDGLTKPILYFTLEGVSQSDTKYLEMRSLAESQRVFCVIDESSLVKNNDAKRTQRLMAMQPHCDFRLILNGTPLSKSLLDLHPQINFLSPRILNMTEAQFASRFLEYDDDGTAGGRPWRKWSKPANEAALVEIIRPYIFDADLEIPAKMEVVAHRFQLSPSEATEYSELKTKLVQSGLQGLDFLAFAAKCQGYYSLCAAKREWAKSLNNGVQHLIFCRFLSEVDALQEVLDSAAEYSGRSKCDLKDFESGKVRNLVCTYGSGAYGLNLQFCNRVVFFGQSFDWKLKEQALHRVYRIGQSRDVVVHDLWVGTGLDALVEKSLMKKDKTSTNVQRLIERKGVEAL